MSYLIKNNWFIAVAAFVQCIATLNLFDKLSEANLFYAFSLLFATKSFYSLLRKGDTLHLKEYRKEAIMIELPWLAISSILFFLSIPWNNHILYLIAVGLLCFFYSIHISMHSTRFSLRKNAISKIAIITIVWVSLTTVYPLKVDLFFTNTEFIFILMQLFFVAMLTIPFDFRDAEIEQQKGFSTLPTRFGIETTKKICRGLAILAWICAGFLGLPYLLTMSLLIVIYLRSLNSINSTWSFEKYTLHFDGQLIIQGLILLAISMFYLTESI